MIGDIKKVKKSGLHQELTFKLNYMKFQSSKPNYYHGKNSNSCDIAEPTAELQQLNARNYPQKF